MFIIKHKLQNENDGGSSGDANAADASAANAANNKDDNVDDFSNLWHTDNNASTDTSQQDQQQQQAQQSGAALSQQEKLQAHIDSKNLLDGVDHTALQDPEKSASELSKLVSNVYTATMQDAAEITTQQIDALREEMQQSTNDQLQGSKAIEQLNSVLPYTSSPEFKPIADGVFNRILNQKDMTVDKAIELTSKYFNKLQGDVSKTMQHPPSNTLNGRQVFNKKQSSNNTNTNTQSNGADKSDWIQFLSAN